MTEKNETGSDILARLFATIESRRNDDPSTSYTASLLTKGATHCARKFGEEAVETILAGSSGSDQELTNEGADVIYHLMVLLAARGVSFDDVANELARRKGVSGHEEKAGRD